MKIRVDYTQNTSVNTSASTSVKDSSGEKSFENVLELNQAALKAMTIDAMVDQSATGSVNPDSVDAAAIMAFRSTLPSNIQSPVPEDKPTLGTPQQVPVANQSANKDTTVKETTSEKVVIEEAVSTVFNEGVLKCSDELNQYFLEASRAYGVDVKLLKSIAYAESSFNPNATSKAGAMGIMQMMPGTAKECGVSDPYDPRQSIMGGASYIAKMLRRYDGNVTYALAAYNAGANNVDKYGGVPPFEETQNYVVKVQKYYNL